MPSLSNRMIDLVMNKNNSSFQIHVNTQRLVLFKQLKGSFRIKLSPRQECQNTCQEIEDNLNEWEICKSTF